MYRNRKEQLTVDVIAQQFSHAMRRAYSQLTFEKFCEIIGEPAKRDGVINYYANDKWLAFRHVCEEMAILGTMLDKLVEYGLKDERAKTS